MKLLIIIIISSITFTNINAQDFTNPKTSADKAFRNKDYYEAAYYYKKAAEGLNIVKNASLPYLENSRVSKKAGISDRAYVCYMLAESYRLYENYIEAEGWYNTVLNENFEAKYPLVRLWYGVCLRANQRFDESLVQLRQFASAYKGDNNYMNIANKEINTCLFAKEQYRYPQFIDVVKMKSPWNSDGSDYAIIKRDQNYWFTSSRLIQDDKKHLNRIYIAATNDNYKPEIIKFKKDENKDKLEYGTPVIDPAGKRMYLTRWYKERSKTIYGIYASNWENGEWSSPQLLNSNVNVDGFNSIQPFITANGKQLYFVSNKPGGQGGDDIWLSDLDNKGQPINAINLGKTVNSPLDEQAPYYDATAQRLIYSSKGFLGLGGFDFFESFNKDDNWSAPHNMGYPFNSAKDDLYYYPGTSSNKFYISSDRQSDCCLELFEMYDKRYILTGLIVDCINTKALTGAKISLIDSISKQTIKQITLDQKGRYTFSINTKRPYSLVAEKDGYFTKNILQPHTGKLNSDTLINPDICLQPFILNKPIALKNILYDYGKSSLRPESETVLNELVIVMMDNPKIKIELSSHTDSVGSDAYNQNLSQQRARSCVDYIISKGVSTDRIFAKGYGKAKPIAPNSLPNGKDNPDGRQINRRTEFMVLKIE